MRQRLEGKKVRALPKEWDEYRLARLFGWTKAQIDDTPGHWSDWMLALSDLERSRG